MYMSVRQFQSFEKKANRLNKKLSAKGLPLLTYESEESYKSFGELFTPDFLIRNEVRPSNSMKVVDVKITSDFSNWILETGYVITAYIDHKENLIHLFEEGMDVERFRYRCLCDHCKTSRKRSKTIILRKGDEFIQVGTTCLSDFIHKDVTSIISFLEELFEKKSDEENDVILFDREYVANPAFSLKEVLPLAYRSILDKGFHPASEDISTKGYVLSHLYCKARIELEEGDEEMYDEIYDYMINYGDETSFALNIVQIAKNRFCTTKSLGYVCAAVKNFINEKMDTKKESEYVGNIGDKVSFDGTVNHIASFPSMYGWITVISIEDSDGNIFVWKTNSSVYIRTGNNVSVRGTIKEHNEYKGIKQTVLTRAKISEKK